MKNKDIVTPMRLIASSPYTALDVVSSVEYDGSNISSSIYSSSYKTSIAMSIQNTYNDGKDIISAFAFLSPKGTVIGTIHSSWNSVTNKGDLCIYNTTSGGDIYITTTSKSGDENKYALFLDSDKNRVGVNSKPLGVSSFSVSNSIGSWGVVLCPTSSKELSKVTAIDGLMVYNTTTHKYNVYSKKDWESLATESWVTKNVIGRTYSIPFHTNVDISQGQMLDTYGNFVAYPISNTSVLLGVDVLLSSFSTRCEGMSIAIQIKQYDSDGSIFCGDKANSGSSVATTIIDGVPNTKDVTKFYYKKNIRFDTPICIKSGKIIGVTVTSVGDIVVKGMLYNIIVQDV